VIGEEQIGQIRPIGPMPSAASQLAYVIYTSGLQVERPRGLRESEALGFRGMAADVDDRQRQVRRGSDHLARLSGASRDEGGAQDLVAAHDVAECPRQVRDGQRTGDAAERRDVVGGRAGGEAVEEPEALLGEGERQLDLLPRHGDDGRSLCGSAGSQRLFHHPGEIAELRLGEEAAHRQLDATGGAQAGEHLGGQERVPAQGEEVGLGPELPGAQEVGPGRSIPIGRPISDTRAHIVDPLLRPVPLGSPGELCLGGAGLARGYWRRPGLTAERFVPDPFSGGGERLYRTGDLARFLPDGTVEYLGRTDAQVKIRGFRIEPGEIEAALVEHPAVREAAVVPQEAAGGKRLAAFLVTEEGADLESAALHELLQGLRERLPQWMVPAAVSVVETLPRTPSGKLDRRALAHQDVGQGAPEAPFEAPCTPVEELVAATWAEVLQRDRIGLHDDFFALGGHSLLAAQVISRLRASLGIELPLRTLFTRPKLADLAADVAEALTAAIPVPPLPGGRECGWERGPGGEGPLSFDQQRLWFVAELAPESPMLNIPAPFDLLGPLVATALESALEEVVRRHDAFRATIVRRDGVLRQVTTPAIPVMLPQIDLSALPPESLLRTPRKGHRPDGSRGGLAGGRPRPRRA
jgi:acyl carrier protein